MSSTSSNEQKTHQQHSNHMLKASRRGGPFCADMHDLFSTLILSLELREHTRFFKTFPYTFTTDEACKNLAKLRFSQSSRSSDPNDPARIVTTTTTTTFSMERDIAMGMCQYFMSARLLENVIDVKVLEFRDRGIYRLTPKGLHILERFTAKNGITSANFSQVFHSSTKVCEKLLYLDRKIADDSLHISLHMVEILFRKVSGGRSPNYVTAPIVHEGSLAPYAHRTFEEFVRPGRGFDPSRGVELQDVVQRVGHTLVLVRQVFASIGATDWLLDYSTCCTREEAGEIMAHFVRHRLITPFDPRQSVLSSDVELGSLEPDSRDDASSHSSRGSTRTHAVLIDKRSAFSENLTAAYRNGVGVLYRITTQGAEVARGVNLLSQENIESASPMGSHDNPNSRTVPLDASAVNAGDVYVPLGGQGVVNGNAVNSTGEVAGVNGPSILDPSLSGNNGPSLQNSRSVANLNNPLGTLKEILDEPHSRALFQEYLTRNFCEENLAFYLDVNDLRRRFSTSSSASANVVFTEYDTIQSSEVHHRSLIVSCLLIYGNYLGPMSPRELNIDHSLRSEVVNYLNKAATDVGCDRAELVEILKHVDANNAPALRSNQVQHILRLYTRIQDHVFRLLATDQVPRFVRTESYMSLQQNLLNGYTDGSSNTVVNDRILGTDTFPAAGKTKSLSAKVATRISVAPSTSIKTNSDEKRA